jgi:integrase
MPTLHLTDTNVRDLPTPIARTDFFDDVVTGLCLRVTPTGHKSWAVLYRAGGRLKRLTLDGYPTLTLPLARKAAREALRSVSNGGDPAREKRRARTALTFDALADLYVEQYAKPHKRSWRQDARQLRVFCRPRWGSWRADQVGRSDVRDLLTSVTTNRSGTIANRLRAMLSKLWSWALAEGHLTDHSVRGLNRSKENGSRERVLTDPELLTFWTELAAAEAQWLATPPRTAPPKTALSPDVAFWLRVRLLTAQRGGEVADLRWADVDLERAFWEVPGERYKNGRPHVCPLAPMALKLLNDRRAARPHDEYLCEGGRGRAARSGVGPAFTIPNFDPHDLRRTGSTRMAQAGVTPFLIARVLGHVERSVTGIYNRWSYLEEKRSALTLWEAHVTRTIGVEP